jgi:hypothetical protein
MENETEAQKKAKVLKFILKHYCKNEATNGI